jgi:hypothetical protein
MDPTTTPATPTRTREAEAALRAELAGLRAGEPVTLAGRDPEDQAAPAGRPAEVTGSWYHAAMDSPAKAWQWNREFVTADPWAYYWAAGGRFFARLLDAAEAARVRSLLGR